MVGIVSVLAPKHMVPIKGFSSSSSQDCNMANIICLVEYPALSLSPKFATCYSNNSLFAKFLFGGVANAKSGSEIWIGCTGKADEYCHNAKEPSKMAPTFSFATTLLLSFSLVSRIIF